MLHRFSKRCRPFSQNGTERNDKNYGKKTTVLRPYYGTEFEFFLSPTVGVKNNSLFFFLQKYKADIAIMTIQYVNN